MSIIIHHAIKGGKLNTTDLKDLLNASYDNNIENVNDFVKDNSLSTKTSKVYVNKKTGQIVVAHRGTSGFTDWFNNAIYGVTGSSGYKMTPRYKEAELVQKKAHEKYGHKNLTTIGHSQGGLQAELLGGKGKEIITLNKATIPFETTKQKNQYDIKSSGDIVSSLNPFSKNKFEKIIKAKTINPLTEHSIDILNRSNNEIVGYGLSSTKIQSVLFKKPEWTKLKASNWLKKHNFTGLDVDEKPEHLRYRQLDPQEMENNGYHFITKPLHKNIEFIIGYQSNKEMPKITGKGKCSSSNARIKPTFQHGAPLTLTDIHNVNAYEEALEHERQQNEQLQEEKRKHHKLGKIRPATDSIRLAEGTGIKRYGLVDFDSDSDSSSSTDSDSDSDSDSEHSGDEKDIIKKMKILNKHIKRHHKIHGGKLNIAKAFKKLGSTIKKGLDPIIKPAEKYITAKKGGLASDLLHKGVPIVTGALAGATGEYFGGPLGGLVAGELGSKAGEAGANALGKKIGVGLKKRGRPPKGSGDLIHIDIDSHNARGKKAMNKMEGGYLVNEHPVPHRGIDSSAPVPSFSQTLAQKKIVSANALLNNLTSEDIKDVKHILNSEEPTKKLSPSQRKKIADKMKSEFKKNMEHIKEKEADKHKPSRSRHKKGSEEAREHMAKLRAMRKNK